MIWKLIKKDLLRKYHNPGGFILLVLLSLALSLIFGLVFGGGGNEQTMPHVKLLIEDHDQGLASQLIAGAFSRGELAKLFETQSVDSGAGRQMMDKGDASALLIIPKGFSDSLVSEKPTELILVKNPSESFLPKIAEETADILSEGSARLIRIVENPLRLIRENIKSDSTISDAQTAAISIQFKSLFTKLGTLFFPPLIHFRQVPQKEEKKQATGSLLFAYLLAGNTLMVLLFVLEIFARDFFRERDDQTLFRMLASPVTRSQYLAAKLLFLFASGLFAFFLVWTSGVILFGIRIMEPVAFLIFSALIIAALTGVIAMLYAVVKTRAQAAASGPAIIIVLSMLGGAMIPIQSLPGFMKKIAVISPVYWGTDGLQKIVISNVKLATLPWHVGVLLTFAILLNLIAFILFAKKVRL